MAPEPSTPNQLRPGPPLVSKPAQPAIALRADKSPASPQLVRLAFPLPRIRTSPEQFPDPDAIAVPRAAASWSSFDPAAPPESLRPQIPCAPTGPDRSPARSPRCRAASRRPETRTRFGLIRDAPLRMPLRACRPLPLPQSARPVCLRPVERDGFAAPSATATPIVR